MRKSRIFTNTELKSIENREKGSKKDPNGIFYGRVKPKIIEIIMVWIPKKSILKKLIKRGGKND